MNLISQIQYIKIVIKIIFFDYSTDVNKNIYTSELISTDNDYQQYSSELLDYTDISTNI